MGYYTGLGVVVSGGETYGLLREFPVKGHNVSFKLSQKNVYTYKKKSGVSLETAQGEHEEHDLSWAIGGTGDGSWVVFDASGTKKSPSYTRIGDTCLYELTVKNETLTAYTESAVG